MKDETIGAITIAALVAFYSGAVYVRRATERPLAEDVARALSQEASDILEADAVALVPEPDGPIEVWPRGGSYSESLPNREALARWLCSDLAPRETAVIMLRGLPLGRGRIESASREGRLAIEELEAPAVRLECSSRARFYLVEMRMPPR